MYIFLFLSEILTKHSVEYHLHWNNDEAPVFEDCRLIAALELFWLIPLLVCRGKVQLNRHPKRNKMKEKSREHQESPPPTKMADQEIGYIWGHYHCQTSTHRYKAHELWRGWCRERICPMLVKLNSRGNTKALPMFRIKKTLFIVFTIGDEPNNRLFIVMGEGGGGVSYLHRLQSKEQLWSNFQRKQQRRNKGIRL